jgi:hypothetical protein
MGPQYDNQSAVSADMYAKQKAAQLASGSLGNASAGAVNRAPLSAEILQAIGQLHETAMSIRGSLSAKHAHLFGNVPAAPEQLSGRLSGASTGPEPFEQSLASAMQALKSTLDDAQAIAFSLENRL